MTKNSIKITLLALCLKPIATLSYSPADNSSSSNNSPFAAISNQSQSSASFLKMPSLNAFGDSSLNNPSWNTIDFSNSDTGTTGWNGGGGGRGATSGKNPFGFPDEDFTPEQDTASTLAVQG